MPRFARALLAAAATTLAAGCAVRDDPAFHRYAPAGGDPTALQRAEAAVGSLEQALEDLDARMENALY